MKRGTRNAECGMKMPRPGLLALQPEVRMTLVVADQRDPDAVRQLTVNKVLRKPPQISPAEP